MKMTKATFDLKDTKHDAINKVDKDKMDNHILEIWKLCIEAKNPMILAEAIGKLAGLVMLDTNATTFHMAIDMGDYDIKLDATQEKKGE